MGTEPNWSDPEANWSQPETNWSHPSVKGGECPKDIVQRALSKSQRALSEDSVGAVPGRGSHRQNRQHSRGMGISSTPPQTVLVWLSG